MQFINPFSGAFATSTLRKTALANSVAKLFKFGFNPTVSTTDTELDANECDFTDYVSKTITAWTGPVLAPSPGYQLNGGLVQWIVATATITNQVGGYWIEEAGGTVMQIVKFDAGGVPMVVVGDAVTIPPVDFTSATSVSA